MSRPLSILLTAGHPADAIERAGGTLALHVERGDHVTVAILTKGAGGAPGQPAETEAQRQERHAHVRESLKILGIEDIHFMDLDDYALQLRKEYVLQMADILRLVRPDIIITHHPWEDMGYGAGAHGVTSLCTIQSMGIATQVDPASRYPPIPPPVQLFWCMTLPQYRWTATNDLYFDVYIDTTSVVQRKVQALRKIRGPEAEAFAAKYVEAVDGTSGLVSHIGYAEGFMRTLPDVCDSLPVSELQYEYVREPESVMWSKMAQFFAHEAD